MSCKSVLSFSLTVIECGCHNVDLVVLFAVCSTALSRINRNKKKSFAVQQPNQSGNDLKPE